MDTGCVTFGSVEARAELFVSTFLSVFVYAFVSVFVIVFVTVFVFVYLTKWTLGV